MHNVMITGAGKIGSLIACLLTQSNDYQVYLVDLEFNGPDVYRLLDKFPAIQTLKINVSQEDELIKTIKEHKITAVISSLPYFLNHHVAAAALATKAHYFDLTEDTETTKTIKSIAEKASSAFVPQCGLAPGFISIAANSLMQEFEQCLHARLRVGALPVRTNNALQYSLTWSTDGLINEYGNPCFGIEEGQRITLKPLENLETIQLDGCEYEAFNTSGGLGSLGDLYQEKIQTLNYKTIRYPGHCEKMRLLMNELQLNNHRDELKTILQRVTPKTYQDMVIVYVTVEGLKNGELLEKSYLKKIYPVVIHDLEWSAIQVSTASGICVIVDLILSNSSAFRGFIHQESFRLSDVLDNRFGQYFL